MSEKSNDIELPDTITDVVLGPNIDQRCEDARKFLSNKKSHIICYNPKKFKITFDDKEISVDIFDNLIKNYKFKDGQVLIECSSVGVAELLLPEVSHFCKCPYQWTITRIFYHVTCCI